MSKFEGPVSGIFKSLDSGGADFVSACNQLDSEIFDEAKFSPDIFSGLIDVLQDTRLHGLNDSVFLLKIFEYNVDLLDEGQCGCFVSILKSTFGLFSDEASSILSVELLVEIGDGLIVFDFFKTFTSKSTVSKVQCLAVHGFSWLVKKTDNNHLRGLCLAEISKVADFKNGAASAEAEIELRRRAAHPR